jgi:hypothetical protein
MFLLNFEDSVLAASLPKCAITEWNAMFPENRIDSTWECCEEALSHPVSTEQEAMDILRWGNAHLGFLGKTWWMTTVEGMHSNEYIVLSNAIA